MSVLSAQMHSSVTELDYTFDGCTSLVTVTWIPETIVHMTYTFRYCTSLTTAPTIPSGVTHLNSAFYGCTSLTGVVTINADLQAHLDTFEDVDFKAQNLTLAGVSKQLDSIGSTGINYCKECNGCCQNNH